MTKTHAAAVSLTLAQQAAVARLVYALEADSAVAILCGPSGVGKTLVLAGVAAARSLAGRTIERCSARDGVPSAQVCGSSRRGILLVDDAHEVGVDELFACIEAWRRREPAGGVVLAGEGRLLTLVARDARIEQAVMLRAVLGPFTPSESGLAVSARVMTAGTHDECDAIARTIHDIAGGIPAHVVRLADLVQTVAASTPGGRITSADVESLHRRLSLQAA